MTILFCLLSFIIGMITGVIFFIGLANKVHRGCS